ncbi:MAG: cold shock domain-containing protein [Thermodesulfovibrionales bacterium]|nr:cold shock domain-containing protein [Thermodesulfovibrionales bacterium]
MAKGTVKWFNESKGFGFITLGKSIVLPHVRYVNHGGRISMMFHTEVIRINGHYHTFGCNRMDVSGFCLGHRMSREEFLERYCGGIEPK